MYRIEDDTLILDNKDADTHKVDWDKFKYIMVDPVYCRKYINYLEFTNITEFDRIKNTQFINRADGKYGFTLYDGIYKYLYELYYNSDVYVIKSGIRYKKEIFRYRDNNKVAIYFNRILDQMKGYISYCDLMDYIHPYVNKKYFFEKFGLTGRAIYYETESINDEDYVIFNNKFRYLLISSYVPDNLNTSNQSGFIKLI